MIPTQWRSSTLVDSTVESFFANFCLPQSKLPIEKRPRAARFSAFILDILCGFPRLSTTHHNERDTSIFTLSYQYIYNIYNNVIIFFYTFGRIGISIKKEIDRNLNMEGDSLFVI